MKIIRLSAAGLFAIECAAAVFAQDIKLPAPASAAAPAAAPAPAFASPQLVEEFGWFMGKRVGLADLGFTPDEVNSLIKGIAAAASGKESPYDLQKIGPSMDEFIQKKQAVYIGSMKQKSLGEASSLFSKLKENKNVVALPDGLNYEIVKQGDGPAPKPTDHVKVNYTGTLVNGTVFDSSVQRGVPAEFGLGEVIAGWTEGLQKVNKGGKIKLYVPPDLAYGDEGRPGIPPGSALIFDIDLLDITPGAPAPAAIPPPAGK